MGDGAEGSLKLPRRVLVNRELSWLRFNRRVLEQARRREWPLAERLRFLAIYQKNLDEFFMVRIGKLVALEKREPLARDGKTGWTPRQQVRQAVRLAERLQRLCAAVFAELSEELRGQVLPADDIGRLPAAERRLLAQRFEEQLRPLLSPVVVGNRQPFPHIGNLTQALAVELGTGSGPFRLGLVELSGLPSWEAVETGCRRLLLSTARLTAYFANRLFPGETVRAAVLFRVTRSADLPMDMVFDREAWMRQLRRRSRLPVVRLQFDGRVPVRIRDFLCRRLSLSSEQAVTEPLPLDLSFGFDADRLLGLPRPVRKKAVVPACSLRQILREDRLFCYPYESMEAFLELLEEAAADPAVSSIWITIYRLSAHSRVAAALCRAAANGKQVVCLIEWRARFDEQRNLEYAAVLEEAGCMVLDGLPDWKVHAKLCQITLRADGELRRITQIGTGNYNEKTAEQYADLCYLTADPRVGAAAAAVFGALAAGELPPRTAALWTGPRGFKRDLLELVGRETARGAQGLLVWKLNALGDREVMAALVRASQAGVTVRLYVRGICCLRPGVPGFTDRITVQSIIGRYLEHSRIFQFGEGARCRVFMGSGDLLRRNTERRVEVFAELTGAPRERAIALLKRCGEDTENSWRMRPGGGYDPRQTDGPPVDSQCPIPGIFPDDGAYSSL